MDDQHAHRGIVRCDITIQDLSAVRSPIEVDAEKSEPAANVLADAGRAFADPGREDESVDPARSCRHRRDRPRDPMLENRVRQPRSRIAGLRCVLELASPPSSTAEPLDAGVEVESVVERVDPDAALPQQVQHRAGIDRPERVFIGTPSSGLNPIVVSTDRPSATAVTEQPPPR